ncbi:MAG: hypothetical protein KGZ30_04415 [Anaplasmataceae bacterium]|nr:hypothetical protein [Anaplasmataceae bacterium]
MIFSLKLLNYQSYLALAAGVVSFLLVCSSVVLAVLDVFGTQKEVVVRLGYRYAVEATGSVFELGLFGLLLIVMSAINVVLIYELEKRDWLWGKFLGLATLVMGILIFISFQGIIAVN